MIRSVSTAPEGFSFRGRMGSAQVTTGIYSGIETGGALIPVIGPFVSAAAKIVQAFGIGYGCGGTCTAATQVVNQIEPLMKQNLAAAQAQAQANGGCLTLSEAQALEANFNTLWANVLKGCGQVPAPGGTQCIADRQPGGKYDWTSYYLTPIQQIPVCADPSPSQTITTTAPPSSGTTAPPSSGTITTAAAQPNLLLIGAAALGALLIAKAL